MRKGSWAELTFSLVVISQLGACASRKEKPIEEVPADEIASALKADTESLPSDATAAPTTGTSEIPNTSDASAETEKVSRHASGPRRYSFSRTPHIAAAPFKSSDQRWMNAFYFVRSGEENWDTISEKIYGRPDRAAFLKKWNSKTTLEPGAVVYYNSATRPEDSKEIKVFAADFGYGLETLTVQSGDWMSKIGQARYGDVRTWREIASLNPEITNPDRIEIGQVLNVQPTDIDTQAVLTRIIAQVQDVATNLDQAAAAPAPKAPVDEVPAVHAADETKTSATSQPAQDFAPPPPMPEVEQAPPVEQARVEPIREVPVQKKDREPKKATGPPVDYLKFGSILVALIAAGVVIQRRFQARKAAKAAQTAADNVTPFDINRDAG